MVTKYGIYVYLLTRARVCVCVCQTYSTLYAVRARVAKFGLHAGDMQRMHRMKNKYVKLFVY
jgi:hypothetical protein